MQVCVCREENTIKHKPWLFLGWSVSDLHFNILLVLIKLSRVSMCYCISDKILKYIKKTPVIFKNNKKSQRIPRIPTWSLIFWLYSHILFQHVYWLLKYTQVVDVPMLYQSICLYWCVHRIKESTLYHSPSVSHRIYCRSFIQQPTWVPMWKKYIRVLINEVIRQSDVENEVSSRVFHLLES